MELLPLKKSSQQPDPPDPQTTTTPSSIDIKMVRLWLYFIFNERGVEFLPKPHRYPVLQQPELFKTFVANTTPQFIFHLALFDKRGNMAFFAIDAINLAKWPTVEADLRAYVPEHSGDEIEDWLIQKVFTLWPPPKKFVFKEKDFYLQESTWDRYGFYAVLGGLVLLFIVVVLISCGAVVWWMKHTKMETMGTTQGDNLAIKKKQIQSADVGYNSSLAEGNVTFWTSESSAISDNVFDDPWLVISAIALIVSLLLLGGILLIVGGCRAMKRRQRSGTTVDTDHFQELTKTAATNSTSGVASTSS